MRKTALLLPTILLVAACTARPQPATTPAATDVVTAATATARAVAARVVDVYKSPTCGCCHEWEAYMQAAGWSVRAADDPARGA